MRTDFTDLSTEIELSSDDGNRIGSASCGRFGPGNAAEADVLMTSMTSRCKFRQIKCRGLSAPSVVSFTMSRGPNIRDHVNETHRAGVSLRDRRVIKLGMGAAVIGGLCMK